MFDVIVINYHLKFIGNKFLQILGVSYVFGTQLKF